MRLLFSLALVGCGAIVPVWLPVSQAIAAEPEYDLVIRNGQIVDGSGNPWFHGDVAVRGERIVAVGRVPGGAARRDIDARGLIVAPGFIDMHSHSDYLLLEDGDAQSKIRQGVTTEVLGEGRSAGPRQGKLPPRPLKVRGKEKTWTTLGGYFDTLQQAGISVNVASYVGMDNVWESVMGTSHERPSAEQREQMKSLVEEAMKDGAFGLSTMLAMPPGSLATTDDLVEMCKVVARHGGLYSTHNRNEGTGVFEAIQEAIAIGERAGVPVDVIHLKIADQKLWGRMPEVVALIDEARRRGVNVQANVYPYTRGNNDLASIIPPWAHQGGTARMLERLKEPEARVKLKTDIKEGLPGWYNHYTAVGGDWSRMLVSGKGPYEGLTMDRILAARTKGQSPQPDSLDMLFDILIEQHGSVPTVYAHHMEKDMQLALVQPWCSIGSDGSAYSVEGPLRRGNPHPRNFGTFPRVLGVYVRETKLLRLEDAVRKMTSLNAAKLGIRDRGLLRAGHFADLTLFDPERVIDRATYTEPFQYGTGIEYVIVNGQVVLDRGKHTGTHSGRVLRLGYGAAAEKQNDSKKGDAVFPQKDKGSTPKANAAAPADDRESLKRFTEKALKAAGGEKLQAVKAWTFSEKRKGGTTTYRRFIQLPDLARTEIEREEAGQTFKSVIVINGDKGWTVNGNVEEMSAESIAGWRKGVFWVSAPILGPRLLSDPKSVLEKLPEVKVGDRTAVGVKLPLEKYGSIRLYFDKETGRLLKLEQDYKTEQGSDRDGTTEVILSDFREVGGIMVPHKKTQQEGSKVFGEWDVTEYKFADRLDPKLFEKPYQPAFVTEFLNIKKEVEAKQNKLYATLNKETVASRTEDERSAAVQRTARELPRIMAPAAEMVMTAVRPHAAEPTAVEALVWVANSSHGWDPGNEAAELLRKHHLTHKQTIELAYSHKRGPLKWTEPLLRAQLEAADLPKADRPRLLFALAVVKQTYSGLPGMLAQITADELSMQEGYFGKDMVASFRKIDAARAEAEAIQLFTQLREKHGSEKPIPEITFRELAQSAIFEIQNLSVGKTAPEINGTDTDGVAFKLSDYRGKVVLLSFWATWCGPCMALVPHEREIVERLKDKPFALIGVNADTDKAKLKAEMAKAGITWRSFWCGEKGEDSDLPKAWNVTGWPTVYLLDHQGVIRAKQVTGKRLDRAIDKLIGEMDAKK